MTIPVITTSSERERGIYFERRRCFGNLSAAEVFIFCERSKFRKPIDPLSLSLSPSSCFVIADRFCYANCVSGCRSRSRIAGVPRLQIGPTFAHVSSGTANCVFCPKMPSPRIRCSGNGPRTKPAKEGPMSLITAQQGLEMTIMTAPR